MSCAAAQPDGAGLGGTACTALLADGGVLEPAESLAMEERLRRVQLDLSELTSINAELRRENLSLLSAFTDSRVLGMRGW